MAFWSGEKLREHLRLLVTSDGVTSIFNEASIDGAAYRLSVGHEVYVSPTSESRDADFTTIRRLAAGEAFTIPPGQFAFLTTTEVVRIPDDAIALISMRATIKWRGLVNVSGFHADPGFCGRLTFAVFNAGPTIIHLKQGEPWFLIWFADLDRATTFGKTDPPQLEMRSDLINGISGKLRSLEGLSNRMDRVEAEHRTIKVIAGIVITLACLVISVGVTMIVRSFSAQSTTAPTPKPTISANLRPTHAANQ